MLEKLNELFSIIDKPKVISENNNTLKVELNKQQLEMITLKKLIKINDYQQFCKLFSVTIGGKSNTYTREKFIDEKITESEYSKIEKLEIIIDKRNLNLHESEVYYYDLEIFMKTSININDLKRIVYNNTLTLEGPITFIDINDKSSVNNEIIDKPVSLNEYRINIDEYIFDHDLKKKVILYMDYLVITATLLFISDQEDINDEIIINGEKEVGIKKYNYLDCSLNNFQRDDLNNLNLLIAENDTNVKDKVYMLKKIISLYLPDDAEIKDFIEKLSKIYPKFSDTVDNYIDNKVDSYFDNYNKLIEEVIKSSNKITEETNKSITQLLTVLTTILASLFVYFYKSREINSILFLSIVFIFLFCSSATIIYNHITNYRYYNKFIDNYFEVVNSIYSFKESERSIRDKLLMPAIKRYKKTIWIFACITSILTLFIINLFILIFVDYKHFIVKVIYFLLKLT